MPHTNSKAAFFFIFGILIGIGCMFIFTWLANYVGESGYESIFKYERHQEKNSLYLSAFDPNPMKYKLAKFRALKPEVIILGSSRGLMVRSNFFNKDAYNFSHTLQGIKNLESVATSDLLNKKYVILYFDPWWLSNKINVDNFEENKINFFNNYLIQTDKFLKMVYLQFKYNWIVEAEGSKHIGLQAIITNSGYRGDGSFEYGSLLGSKNKNAETLLLKTFSQAIQGEGVFSANQDIDKEKVIKACSTLNSINNSAEGLIIILPPFPLTIQSALLNTPYQVYLDKVDKVLKKCLPTIDIYNYSLTNKASLAKDCEFIDGYHQGDVTNARIFADIADKNYSFRSVINKSVLQKFIAEGAGLASFSSISEGYISKEPDFLNLGCVK